MTIQESALRTRPAAPSDLNWLIQLRIATMSEHIENSGTKLSYADHQARVQQDYHFIQIVLLKEQPIGMYKVVCSSLPWQLVQFQIAPAHQGLGFGNELLQSIMQQADAADALLHLSVLKVNPAKRLYERLGFRIIEDQEHSFKMQRKPATG